MHAEVELVYLTGRENLENIGVEGKVLIEIWCTVLMWYKFGICDRLL
jgi:hypothetical protein